MDEIDICTILANALDNATDACLTNKSDRWIELSCVLHDNGNFSIDIRNACDTPVEFGKTACRSPTGGGHGLGLKSIHAVVQKYNGLLRCTCENRVFRLSAALFQPDNVPTMRFSGMKRTVANTALTLLLLLCFINIFPDTVQALESVPFVGNVLRLADFFAHTARRLPGAPAVLRYRLCRLHGKNRRPPCFRAFPETRRIRQRARRGTP